MKLIHAVCSKIKMNQTIEKYNRIYSINILETMNFDKSFRWSEYYWYISKLSNTLNYNSFDVMYSVELIGIAARVMDDLLDNDTELANKICSEHLSLLSTELLVESLELIGGHKNFDYNLLREALNAEFLDYSTVVDTSKSIDFYFQNIVQKSTAIFRLITKLGSNNNDSLDKFANHYGTLLQIENDIIGILKSPSTDISELKSTLPLIASISTLNSSNNKSLLLLLNNPETSIQTIQGKIIETGAIDFCKELVLSEKMKALTLLEELECTNDMLEFKNYLELET
ncbi:hypothetical protein [Enterococcus termitis]|uniref:Geranylgeranyl pyrophosphate synthase n=1 Tax=Enterococcus termitis TaxID=332950 RepID=A0A1E5H0N4_9ENTE|nr:hypothetical protein [Enterococcus termitis]OEG18443.1 hypothetical protein BCR25_16610 [Enterococcus termitis]OJG96591.1 hypothetical protein RV18_GL002097 [Enterococcus termitis]